MAILNYTTKIQPSKTIGEIQGILAKHGAKNISVDYENGLPIALTFLIEIKGEFINFRLPSNHIGVYKVLCNSQIAKQFKTQEQARRVAWRIVKDWVEAQVAIIEAGLATLPQVFLPYAILSTGETVYDAVSKTGLKVLEGSK